MIPRRAGTTRRHATTSGFTLLEILLVLGLLVILAAFAWPSLSRPLAATRLREGARGLCNELGRARLRAIETGNVLVLRYAAGGSRYEIITRMAAAEGNEVGTSDDNELLGTISAGDGTSRTWPAGAFVPVRGILPDAVRFVRADSLGDELAFEGEPLVDAGEDSVADMGFDSISGELSGGIDSGTVVYLYPDGTARDATIRLANQDGASIEITLRGMTGTTRLGPVVEPEVNP